MLKDLPIERSGTATITLSTALVFSLSSAINIKALDFPDAGGAFMSKYWAARDLYARACISRIPSSSIEVLFPVA